MRVGIGLPAAVPETDMTLMGRWAAEAERAGFASVGVIDRLTYDNLDPLTALAAAAARTSRVELMSTVVNVCWRNNAVLLAKQLSSVDDLRSPESQPGAALHAFEVFEEIAPATAPQAAALCDWLESVSLPDGGLPFALPLGMSSGSGPGGRARTPPCPHCRSQP